MSLKYESMSLKYESMSLKYESMSLKYEPSVPTMEAPFGRNCSATSTACSARGYELEAKREQDEGDVRPRMARRKSMSLKYESMSLKHEPSVPTMEAPFGRNCSATSTACRLWIAGQVIKCVVVPRRARI